MENKINLEELPINSDLNNTPFIRVVTASVGKGPTRCLRRYGLSAYSVGDLPELPIDIYNRLYGDSWIFNQGDPAEGLALVDEVTDLGYTVCIGNPGVDTNVWLTREGINFLKIHADNPAVLEMKMFREGLTTFFGTPHTDANNNTVGVFCSSVGMNAKYPNDGTVADAVSEFPEEIRRNMCIFAKLYEKHGMPWGKWVDEYGNHRNPGDYPTPLEMSEGDVKWLGLKTNKPDRTDLLAACSKPGDPEADKKKAFFDNEVWRYVLSIAIQHWCEGFIGLNNKVYLITFIDEVPAPM